jgi:phosphoglycerate dehydrogenase-like enzyme
MDGAVRRVVFNMRDERPVWSPPAWVASRLRAALPPGVEFVDVAAPVSGRGDGGGVSAAAVSAVRGAEVYLGLGLPRELLLAALEPPARLRWVHSGAAGVGSLLHPELAAAGITLTNSAGIHGPPMAETVIGMILYFARGLDRAVAAQQQGEWGAAAFEQGGSAVREIAGATVGIVGLGGVGREVARRAAALGMRVIGVRRRAHADHDAPARGPGHAAARVTAAHVDALLTGDDALDRLCADSDFVVLTLPSTAATRGLIGEQALRLMKPEAVLINVARGDIVDEAALISALAEGRLRGAALDVFATEPLPATSPLWRLPNVLITPHVSATSERYWERELELILDNLQRYERGASLRNVVDPGAGY